MPAPTADYTVINPHPGVEGVAYRELAADWYKWVFEAPFDQNPLYDHTGDWAYAGNTGPVFFLAGSWDGSVVRHIDIPAGTPVMIPAWNAFSVEGPGYATPITPYPGPDSNPNYAAGTNKVLAAYLNNRADFPDDGFLDRSALHVSINGQEVTHVASYFIRSGNFDVGPLAPGSFLDVLGGDAINPGDTLPNNKAVGYYVIIDNLRDINPGITVNDGVDYVIQFEDKGATVTDYIHIV